jgi:glycosyltransferase involved in cell wall biosynthesis
MVPSVPGEPIRVAIDASSFRSPAPGVRRYVTELCQALREGFSDRVALVGIGPPSAGGEGDHLLTNASEGWSPFGNLGRSAMELPVAIRRSGAAVFHAPAYTAPLWGSTPVVLTIHDVSYERHPEWYPYRRDSLRRWFYRRSAARAGRIITVSQFSSREIQAAYDIAPSMIAVIPHGVGRVFALPESAGQREADRIRAAAVTGDDDAPFLLHVGDIHARRDLPVAAKALAAVRQGNKRLGALRLVLIGTDRGGLTEVMRAASDESVGDAVVVRNGLDDPSLAALYRTAAALVYPSRYEGFGLPLLEAMASGLPIVAARAGATSEVVGDAAVLVEPGAVAEWVRALEAMLSAPDDGMAADLRARGRRRAAAFTWARAAERTVGVYESCLTRTSR